jgi:hypothetical protein
MAGYVSGTVNTTNLGTTFRRGVPGVITDKVDVYTLTCGSGYNVNYESDTGKVSCVRADGYLELEANPYLSTDTKQNFTSNVNEFKSRKGRNVESFSQNTNGKCKARY